MGSRRKSRELAVQVLFQLEFDRGEPGEAFGLISHNFHWRATVQPFARQLVDLVCRNREELDRLIQQASEHWRVARMACLDRTILRIAACELLYAPDIPPKVSIDEAVELGKRLGGDDSSAFINGVLDKVYSLLQEQGRLHKDAPEAGTSGG